MARDKTTFRLCLLSYSRKPSLFGLVDYQSHQAIWFFWLSQCLAIWLSDFLAIHGYIYLATLADWLDFSLANLLSVAIYMVTWLSGYLWLYMTSGHLWLYLSGHLAIWPTGYLGYLG